MANCEELALKEQCVQILIEEARSPRTRVARREESPGARAPKVRMLSNDFCSQKCQIASKEACKGDLVRRPVNAFRDVEASIDDLNCQGGMRKCRSIYLLQ